MVLDSETFAMIEVARREAPFAFLKQTGLATVGSDVPLRPEVEEWLRGRVEWVAAGVERCPQWFKKTLQRFDKDLRLRWDSYKEHWVIERFNERTQLFHRVGQWNLPLDHRLIDALRKGDQWNDGKTAEDRIQESEDRAAKQREDNDKKAQDGWLEAVDSLTRRQQEDFVEISRAIEHGEDIQFMGPDADFMNKIWEEKKKRPDMNEQVKPLNPGMKPGVYQRAKKEQ